jgi:hypothetical protein
MTGPVSAKRPDFTKVVNKVGYAAFVLLALYFLIFSQDPMEAAVNLMIALVFDPFRQDQPFSARPFYQRAWLMIHVALGFILFGYAFFG